ncbi:hypothetical protein FRB91_011717 [Serendipita sp. 411]|nr:hypothetical protein FRB91_011717 [Serendipita sp. 411]
MYLGKETSLSRRSSAVGPERLSIIIGVCVPVFAILCIILAILLWKIRARKASERRISGDIPEKLRITPYALPTPPKIFQPASSILEPTTPAPTTPPTALTRSPSGANTGDSSAPHYRTWRTAAAAKAFGQSGYYGDRDSIGENGPRLQARSAQSTANDMTDLISLLNSRRVDTTLSPPTTTYELGGKAMRPISVDSLSAPTIVASHSGSKEFELPKGGHKQGMSMDKGMEEGYASEGSVPSLLRKPKYNPVTGAPMIPSIYFGQPFDVESEAETSDVPLAGRTASRRPSQRVPSTLSRSRTQNSTTTTIGRTGMNPVLLEAPIEEDLGVRVQHHQQHQQDIRPMSTYTTASLAPTASVYPESRTSVETVDRPPLPSRAIKEARSGWI